MTAMWVPLQTGVRGSLGIATGACCVVVRGTTDRGTCVLRIAAGIPPEPGTTTAVFELSGDFNSCVLTSLPLVKNAVANPCFFE